jgi:ubiquinone/menaquinone biosynthesis C-methylase UbiE
MKKSNYAELSLIYNSLMKKINYEYWANYIYAISKIDSKKIASALELGGGTGKLAEFLFHKYKTYVLSDLNSWMLSRNEKSKVSKVCCDMRAIPFKTKFDLIFSTFDSVNYLTSKTAFMKFLSESDKVLLEDGTLTFDVSLERNSLRYEKLLNRKGELNNVSFIQKSVYDKKTKLHINEFELKLPDGKIIKEKHKQKIWDIIDYFNMIDKSKFYVQHCFETFTFTDIKKTTERAQFILKKKNYAKR